MIEGMFQGLVNLSAPDTMLWILLGIMLGLVVGITPAIGGIPAAAMILAFIPRMPILVGMALLLGIYAVSKQGGSITAILLNIPGTNTNIATLIDGFPMTRKGEGARALGAAFTASALGGVIAVFIAVGLIPLIVPMIFGLRTPDLLFIIVLGLSFVVILSEGSMIKGLIAGCIGLMLAFVGYQDTTGVFRFTFGLPALLGGISLVPLIMGLFAGAELLDLGVSRQTIAPPTTKQKITQIWRQELIGVKDTFKSIFLSIRSSIIGFITGAIPGVGGNTAAFICYGQAKMSSKNPEEFGKGRVEGVIAPESANNAVEAGSMLTTMAFGIPGSAYMALFLGAFYMMGMEPGANMFKYDLDLVFSMLWILAITNIVGTIICFFIAPYLLKVTAVNPRYLMATLLIVIFVGAFAVVNNISGVILFLVFTFIGLIMKRYGYSRVTLALGFILGFLFEKYLWLSITIGGPLFFVRGVTLGIIAITILIYVYKPIVAAVKRVLPKVRRAR
jgi:putative tricarboxylic transport membrane protein